MQTKKEAKMFLDEIHEIPKNVWNCVIIHIVIVDIPSLSSGYWAAYNSSAFEGLYVITAIEGHKIIWISVIKGKIWLI